MNDFEQLKEEFKSAEAQHRFEASIMLGQTAVYLVATGTLIDFCMKSTKETPTFDKMGITVFGLILSIIFFVIISRCGKNLRGARKRAGELGERLDFKLYSSSYRAPKGRIFVGVNVTKTVCIVGGIWWTVMLSGIILKWPV